MLLIHLLSVVGLILLPLPAWPIFLVAVVLYWLGGLGTTVAYHRGLAHRAVVLNPLVERLLVFCAMFNGSGNPLTWVANHRLHHANSDTANDISSPRIGGFWWAHLRWLWQANPAKPDQYCPDLIRRGYRWWRHFQVPILGISLFGGFLALWPLIGWYGALAACLWLGPLRLVLALHVQCTVNSISHLGPDDAEHGTARNLWWMTPLHLGQGENWHANHHRSASDPRLGRRWWQIDTGWWCIAVLGWCHLASRIRIPSSPRTPAEVRRSPPT